MTEEELKIRTDNLRQELMERYDEDKDKIIEELMRRHILNLAEQAGGKIIGAPLDPNFDNILFDLSNNGHFVTDFSS